jgi:hypothetical protein
MLPAVTTFNPQTALHTNSVDVFIVSLSLHEHPRAQLQRSLVITVKQKEKKFRVAAMLF